MIKVGPMKIIGIDLGDKWIGIALSDALRMTCKPYMTSTAKAAAHDLIALCKKEPVSHIVFGLPRTMKGEENHQAIRSREQGEELFARISKDLPTPITYSFWDERLSSQYAKKQMKETSGTSRGKPDHALAAAFFLQNYLDAHGASGSW
jgi:putative holliday junction resolvase